LATLILSCWTYLCWTI